MGKYTEQSYKSNVFKEQIERENVFEIEELLNTRKNTNDSGVPLTAPFKKAATNVSKTMT